MTKKLKIGEYVYCDTIITKTIRAKNNCDPMYGKIQSLSKEKFQGINVYLVESIQTLNKHYTIKKGNSHRYFYKEMRRITKEERKSLIAELI